MNYQNPIIRGFYPDPSICAANGKFYMVCSSFQYFPGVPLFESIDLVNWKQIGHVLTRHSQVMVDKVRSSGGVFAPTIRFNDGRFYMVTNNNSTNENFYVYTDDIYSEWSDPVIVDQDGIDPSLLFDNGHVYFVSNGTDENNLNGVVQCEIDISTGAKLSHSQCIWQGSGGRYLESPHMYKIGNYYYLMAAEGGTEYGHMVTYARSQTPWGPFSNYPDNPVLTNRDTAPGIIQGIGHGDLIQNNDGNWYIVTLGFRQIHLWQPYHHLGREVFLTPVSFNAAGWFTCGDGITRENYEIPGDFVQERKNEFTFENTDWTKDWCYLRKYDPSNYELGDNFLVMHGTNISLEDVDSPSFIGLRQMDFDMTLTVDTSLEKVGASMTDTYLGTCVNVVFDNAEPKLEAILPTDQMPDSASVIDATGTIVDVAKSSTYKDRRDAGISLFMCENEHYDLFIRPRIYRSKDVKKHTTNGQEYVAVLRLCIGDVKHEQRIVNLSSNHCTLKIVANAESYSFYAIDEGNELYLGKAQSKYLSSEVSSGFTGIVIGLFAEGKVTAKFTNFKCQYLAGN